MIICKFVFICIFETDRFCAICQWCFWGHSIDQALLKKQRLIPGHYTKIFQRLCDMVYNETHQPSNLREFVDTLLIKYSGITYIDDKGYHDVKYTKVSIVLCMGYFQNV
jgi:hypothetical protein